MIEYGKEEADSRRRSKAGRKNVYGRHWSVLVWCDDVMRRDEDAVESCAPELR